MTQEEKQGKIATIIEEITREVLARMAEEEEEVAAETAVSSSSDDIAHFIDHTLLKPEATQTQIAQLCAEARTHQFASVCVNPVHVQLSSGLLQGTAVDVCTVVGFPLGATTTAVKVFETREAVQSGATEIDMVIDVGALKAGDYVSVLEDIAAVVRAAHEEDALVKVIIEAALLTDEEKAIACRLAQVANAEFVKTSTGFGPGGATLADVKLMRETVGPKMGVKAAGGIRSYADAQAMIDAGATRLGASAGVKIIQEESQ